MPKKRLLDHVARPGAIIPDVLSGSHLRGWLRQQYGDHTLHLRQKGAASPFSDLWSWESVLDTPVARARLFEGVLDRLGDRCGPIPAEDMATMWDEAGIEAYGMFRERFEHVPPMSAAYAQAVQHFAANVTEMTNLLASPGNLRARFAAARNMDGGPAGASR